MTMRALLTALLGLLFVLPLPCGGGGDTSGGSGIWILPRSSSLASLVPVFITPPLCGTHIDNLSQAINMKVSSEVVNPIAILTDPVSNLMQVLQVNSGIVTIPAGTISGYAAAGVTTVVGTIIDQTSHGYYMQLVIDLTRQTADLYIY